MQFMPQLGRFLRENKAIHTVRKYKMADKEVDAEWVGLCTRTLIGIVKSLEDLEPYVKDSGFKTKEDWWKKIREFAPNKKDVLYLYRVEVKEKVK